MLYMYTITFEQEQNKEVVVVSTFCSIKNIFDLALIQSLVWELNRVNSVYRLIAYYIQWFPILPLNCMLFLKNYLIHVKKVIYCQSSQLRNSIESYILSSMHFIIYMINIVFFSVRNMFCMLKIKIKSSKVQISRLMMKTN